MSGGHYNYAYHNFNNFATDLETRGDANREKFKKILLLVAEAARSVEWFDSGDYGPEEEYRDLKALFDCLKEDV